MNLSIIIPVYNVAEYIENCIHSLNSQGLDPLQTEIILVNDGSTDNSYSICQSLKNEYSTIRLFTQENRGLSATRNVGLEKAQGKYVYFFDSDDYLESNYLNRFLQIALNNDLCWVAFDKFITYERFVPSTEVKELNLIHEGDGIELMANYNVDNAVWIYLAKRETISQTRFIEGRTCEDGIFTFEILQNVVKGQIYSNQVYGYFFNQNSIVRTKNTARLKQLNDDLFFITIALDRVIETLPSSHLSTPAAFLRIRDRQEAYLFFWNHSVFTTKKT